MREKFQFIYERDEEMKIVFNSSISEVNKVTMRLSQSLVQRGRGSGEGGIQLAN